MKHQKKTIFLLSLFLLIIFSNCVIAAEVNNSHGVPLTEGVGFENGLYDNGERFTMLTTTYIIKIIKPTSTTALRWGIFNSSESLGNCTITLGNDCIFSPPILVQAGKYYAVLGMNITNNGNYLRAYQSSIASYPYPRNSPDLVWNKSVYRTRTTNGYVESSTNYQMLDTIITNSNPFNYIFLLSQTPADITTTNIFGTLLNISYNYTYANTSNAYINYTINLSSSIKCIEKINGTCSVANTPNKIKLNSSKSGAIINFNFNDNEVYPAEYNYNESIMESTPHSIYTTNNQNNYIIVSFINLTYSNYNMFEFMANSSGEQIILNYRNSSGHNADFYTISGTIPFNHTHSIYSKHHLVPFILSNNQINGITATPNANISIRSLGNNPIYIYYIPNKSRSYATMVTSNNGVTYTELDGTIDAHFHFFDINTTFNYKACGTILGSLECSIFTYDNLDLTYLTPSSPIIYSPTNTTYGHFLFINYSNSTTQIGTKLSYFNLSLYYENLTFYKIIKSNNSLNLTYNLDLWGLIVDNGYYRIKVEVYNNVSLSAYSYSQVFNVENNRIYLVNYSQYINYSGNNYARNLSYNIKYSCAPTKTLRIFRSINGIFDTSYLGVCDDSIQDINYFYIHSIEGLYNISFYYNLSDTTYREYSGNLSVLSDLYAPTAVVNYTLNFTGFGYGLANITLFCNDSISPYLNYTKYFNNTIWFNGNLTTGTIQYNTTYLPNGYINITGICRDFFSTDTDILIKYIFNKNFILIDEKDNTIFNLNNCSGARVYFDDNSTFFDFKDNNQSNISFITDVTNKLRFELLYNGGVSIIRYVDVALLAEKDIRVCANKEGVTSYEQLIISATQRPVVLKSVFSNCVIAADYTRFAYQDSYLLKAYTINTLYYLYTFINEIQTFLASVDGSVQTYINIDNLEFQQNEYDLSLITDAFNTQQVSNTTTLLNYFNQNEDNTALDLYIYNLDTDLLIFQTSDFDNPNQFSINFDYSTLNNVTDTTIFKVVLDKSKEDGTIEQFIGYFNIYGSFGYYSSALALTIGIILTMFGLTFSAAKITFSWFGIIVCLGSIAFMAFGIPAWYLTFMMAIDLIICVFIIINMAMTPQTAFTA